MTILVITLCVALLTLLAFKIAVGSGILFTIIFFVCMVVAFQCPDLITGISETSDVGITAGIAYFIYGMAAAGFAFLEMFSAAEDQ